MAELIQNYDFDDAITGNTYDAVIFNLPEEVIYSLTGAKIFMQLRKKPGQNVAIEFSTDNMKMEILTPFSFALKAQIIDVVPDTYYYDILIEFLTGYRATYIGGKWTVHPVITSKR